MTHPLPAGPPMWPPAPGAVQHLCLFLAIAASPAGVTPDPAGPPLPSLTMTSPLVSVVVTNHNYGRFLGECLESALNQDYSPVEVVVVDDGSTDNSRQVLRGFGPSIETVLQECGGQAAAANAG